MMLRFPLANCRNSQVLSLTCRRLLYSVCFRSDVFPAVISVLNGLGARQQRHCRRTFPRIALPHSAGNNSPPIAVEPSTHRTWLFQGHLAGRGVRHFSVCSVRCVDADDQSEKSKLENKGLRSRGLLRKGMRQGRQEVTKSNQGESDLQESQPNRARAISSEVIDSNEAILRDASLEESDELINIHNPRGKQLENVNEFDAQYFSEGLSSDTRTLNVVNGSEIDETFLPDETEENMFDEGLNEIDQQYFGNSVTFANPKRRKSQFVSRDRGPIESRTWLVSHDVNEIDTQYFVKSNQNSADQVAIKSHRKQNVGPKYNEPAYVDTSFGEETILQELKRKDELHAEMAVLAKNAMVENYEPHEKATRINFKMKVDSDKHVAAQFEHEKDPLQVDISKELKKELKAARKALAKLSREKEDEEIMDTVEPEVRETLMSLKKKEKHSTSKKLSNQADPSIETSKKPCSGCGAFLHCHSVDNPGFMPKEEFLKFMENVKHDNHAQTMKAVCIRCWNLIKQREALNVNVNQEDYMNIIKKIRRKRALVLVMVDLLDFPCSFIPNLQDIIGNKHMCLVGNKIDLLPVDSKSYDLRIKDHLLKACVKAGVCSEENVQEILLISAKTGYGIERLITKLHRNWGTQGDVYILGTANVGKSTLFNRLLESDYCKSKASYLLGKATISCWPGTTLNLLRFPIINLDRIRAAMRSERLKLDRLEEQDQQMKEYFSQMRLEQKAKELFDRTAYVKGNVGRTFNEYNKFEQELGFNLDKDPFNITMSSSPDTTAASTAEREKLPFDFDPVEFEDGRWFYDTPGVIYDQQVLTKLTLEELKAVVPTSVIQPKTLTLKPGQSFFLAGLGRLDYLQGAASIFFTMFACRSLPIRIVATDQADDFYAKHAGNKYLQVPMGGSERMKTFPALQPVDMHVTGVGWNESAADILFSSAGWAAVTAGFDMPVQLRAYTPGGNGCHMRQPALLPLAIQMRGKRQKGTPFYSILKEKLVKYM